MATYSESYTKQQSFTQKPVAYENFFDGLKKKVAKKAHQATADRAYKMQQILALRKSLGKGWGRFPKWQPNVGEYPKTSNRSFSGWRVKSEGNGIWSLRNEVGARATGPWKGYSYVRNLTNGTGWSVLVRTGMNRGNSTRLVRGPFGTIFSSQMPLGLSPWLKHQRELLKSDIDQIIKENK